MRRLFATLVLVAALPLAAQEAPIGFQPRVGAIGARVTVTGMAVPPGSEVRFGTRAVPVLKEEHGFSFLVPAGAATSFIEIVRGGRVLARTAVPFVVTGTSLVSAPRLMGLKEAIDVFGYSEPVPESAKTETRAKPVLRLDDEDILTLGEPTPNRFEPAVMLHDAASMATQGMGPSAFVITARPPKKRYTIPPPSAP